MKVSVITVVWNNKETVKDAIDSVLSQTYKNIEYIIIDGASSDGTIDIVESYGDKITKFVSDPDKGIYDGLNKGISLATGNIIGFLHADDYYPNKDIISNVVSTFSFNPETDIVIGDVSFIDKDHTVNRHYSGKNFDFNIGVMPPHPAVFIRKKCYEKFGNFNTKYEIASDYDFLYRLIVILKIKYVFSSDIIVHMSPGGASTKNIMSTLILNKEIYQIHKAHNNPIRILDLLKKIPLRMRELVPE